MSTPTTELVARLADAFEFMMDGKAEAGPLALLQDATESAQAPSIAECVPLIAIARAGLVGVDVAPPRQR